MSMIRCDRCRWIIDSDDDPDCFVEQPGGKCEVICEGCRTTLEQNKTPEFTNDNV